MEQILLIVIVGLVAFIAWQVAGRPRIAKKWLITGIAGLALLIVMWGTVTYPATITTVEVQQVESEQLQEMGEIIEQWLEERQPFKP